MSSCQPQGFCQCLATELHTIKFMLPLLAFRLIILLLNMLCLFTQSIFESLSKMQIPLTSKYSGFSLEPLPVNQPDLAALTNIFLEGSAALCPYSIFHSCVSNITFCFFSNNIMLGTCIQTINSHRFKISFLIHCFYLINCC